MVRAQKTSDAPLALIDSHGFAHRVSLSVCSKSDFDFERIELLKPKNHAQKAKKEPVRLSRSMCHLSPSFQAICARKRASNCNGVKGSCTFSFLQIN